MIFYKRQKGNVTSVRQFSEMTVSRQGGYPKHCSDVAVHIVELTFQPTLVMVEGKCGYPLSFIRLTPRLARWMLKNRLFSQFAKNLANMFKHNYPYF